MLNKNKYCLIFFNLVNYCLNTLHYLHFIYFFNMPIKKIEKIFSEFYEKHPLRFGITPEELSLKLKLSTDKVFQLMEKYNNLYDYNGKCFFKKGRIVLLNENLEKIKVELLSIFSKIQKLDIDEFSIKYKINQKAIINLINYLEDINKIDEIKKHKIYLTTLKINEIKQLIIDNFHDSFFTIKDIKSLLNIPRELAIDLMEYFDKKYFTIFYNGKRYLNRQYNNSDKIINKI